MPISIPIPPCLQAIPKPPSHLFHEGAKLDKLLKKPCVAIVGSRRVTPYGNQVTSELASKLAERGIVIVSGLALGVDGLAHRAALEVGGLTIAVLPSPIEKILPSYHWQLAQQILQKGGAIVSEYGADEQAYKYNFVNRNRLVSGLADVLIITEAAEKSGSLHTANFALDQGKTVMAVPGRITSPMSVGTNNLIKQGALPVTSYRDVLYALGVEDTVHTNTLPTRNPQEQAIVDLLVRGVEDGDLLLEQSALEVSIFNQTLTMLEIDGRIRPLGNNQWALI